MVLCTYLCVRLCVRVCHFTVLTAPVSGLMPVGVLCNTYIHTYIQICIDLRLKLKVNF